MTGQGAQYFAALVVSALSISYGVNVGWSSPTIDLLSSDDSPLPTGKITMEEASWIASLLAVGSVFGNIACGFMMNKYGRKFTSIVMTVPMIVCWIFVLVAQNIYYIFMARFLHGFISGGMLIVAPVYLQEIANDRNRGTLVSFVMMSGNIGMIIAFTLGAFCSFQTTPIFEIALVVSSVIPLMYLHESPTYLFKEDRIVECVKSIKFYQNIKEGEDERIQLEMSKLRKAIGHVKSKKSGENKLSWSDLTTRPGSKAMIIGTVLSALVQLSGCFAIISYAANIFTESGSALSPNVSTIVIGVIQLLGTISQILLVDRAGRRFLYMVSTVGATLGLITLGVYIILKSKYHELEVYNWIPIVCLSFVIYIASLAISSLSFTIVAEIMPEKMKEFGVTYCNLLMSICAFIAIKYFPFLNQLLGLHGSMFLFAGYILLSAVYIILCMPETKGKSYEQIMKSLRTT